MSLKNNIKKKKTLKHPKLNINKSFKNKKGGMFAAAAAGAAFMASAAASGVAGLAGIAGTGYAYYSYKGKKDFEDFTNQQTKHGKESFEKFMEGFEDFKESLPSHISDATKKAGVIITGAIIGKELFAIIASLTCNLIIKLINEGVISYEESKKMIILSELIKKFQNKIQNDDNDFDKMEITELEIISKRTKNVIKYLKDNYELSNDEEDFEENKEYLETIVKLEESVESLDNTISEYKGYFKNFHSTKRHLKRTSKKISNKTIEKYNYFINYLINLYKQQINYLMLNINQSYDHFTKSISYKLNKSKSKKNESDDKF